MLRVSLFSLGGPIQEYLLWCCFSFLYEYDVLLSNHILLFGGSVDSCLLTLYYIPKFLVGNSQRLMHVHYVEDDSEVTIDEGLKMSRL